MLSIENSALIIIDMQGKLWNVMHEKEALMGNVQRLIKGLQVLGVPIILTEQNPKGLGPTVPEITQLIPGVQALPKSCFNCGEEKNFEEAISTLKRKQLLICGIETHICVYQTTLDLLKRGYEVQVVTDAVSSRVYWNTEITFMRVQSEGAKLTTTEMVIYELLKTAEDPMFKEILKVVK